MKDLLIGNDMRVYFKDPIQDQDGNAITSGTVEATLYEANISFGEHTKGDEVTGGAFTLSHEGGGVWAGILDNAAELENGAAYFLTVAATVGSTDGQWDILCRARWRQ